MGYSYDMAGRLCCDICGKAGGVRKYKCPFGWCPATAACLECRKGRHAEHFTAAWHRHHDCEKASKAFHAAAARKAELQAAGKRVRCSALKAGGGVVHVLFRGGDGSTVGVYMAAETYAAVPLGDVATVEDYAAHGDIRPAPATFDGGRITKRVG